MDQALNDQVKAYVQRVAKNRAPWFSSSAIKEISWWTHVLFEHRVVTGFGNGRCWLAGDAAHQTGPIGAQSMNVGLLEADLLATGLRKVLRDKAPIDTLAGYNQQCQARWRQLLGLSGGLKAAATVNPWVSDCVARLLPCVPGSDQDLVRLVAQLGLTISP
jgi:2-polyprenyl-6-methoxyphenol hydroxylase-like FAD-dependent oxidoreductase